MSREKRIKRMIYQSWHRGCKETDVLLGHFAKTYLPEFSDTELDQFEAFIKEDDWDIYAWLTGKLPFPNKHNNDVVDRLRHFNVSEILQ